MHEKQYIGEESMITISKDEFNAAIAKAHEEGYQESKKYKEENDKLRNRLNTIADIAKCAW